MTRPKFRLEVEGAEDREKMLENDDLLPVPLENRSVEAGSGMCITATDDQDVGLLDLYHFLVQRCGHAGKVAGRGVIFDCE
jgi:hypothetical protein